MADRIVFYAWGAWVSQILSETRCKVWLSRPEGAPFPDPHAELVLNRTPRREVLDGTFQWKNVDTDDHNDATNKGATTIGGTFPWSDMAAGVYLPQARHEGLRKEHPELAWPQTDGPPGVDIQPHHLMSTLYIETVGGKTSSRRYHGFHAKFSSIGADGKGEFEVCEWNAGTDLSKARRVRLNLETDVDWKEAEPLSTVKAPGDIGALFIRWKACDEVETTPAVGGAEHTGANAKTVGLRSPKLPLGLGGATVKFYHSPEQPDA